MPKKIRFESAVHHFLAAARRVQVMLAERDSSAAAGWSAHVASLRFGHLPNDEMDVSWAEPTSGCTRVSYQDARFYLRGDTSDHVNAQRAQGLLFSDDDVRRHNERVFDEHLRRVALAAGVSLPRTG